MPRELHQKISKNKKNDELTHKKKQHIDSDENDENDEDDYNSSDLDNMNIHEIRKYINNVMPTKHIEKKIKADENFKNKS